MYLKSLEILGFKSFGHKTDLKFTTSISSIVGPNGSGKSNVAEAFRFVLGEQSIKSMRGKRGEDLIFSGGQEGNRANRASVKLIFDNSTRNINIDFDEVILERTVHRDGVNEYFINGSGVRLKDVLELLSSAHIGASGHHIISQGEADRMLTANIRERREMIEDALGLQAYHYKKDESLRKLDKTQENIKQVESLRRELAPHIKFLKKQVEKIEKAIHLKEELISCSKEYVIHEENYISETRKQIHEQKTTPSKELETLALEIEDAKKLLASSENDTSKHAIIELESKLEEVRRAKDSIVRNAGKIEGEISYLERLITKEKEKAQTDNTKTIFFKEVEELSFQISEMCQNIESLSVSELQKKIADIKTTIASFVQTRKDQVNTSEIEERLDEISKLKIQKQEEDGHILEIQKQEEELLKSYAQQKEEMEKVKDDSRDAERNMFKIMSRQNELHVQMEEVKRQERTLDSEEEEYKRTIQEIAFLVGPEAIRINQDTQLELETRGTQIERKRNIERLKIRLEEAGGGGGADVIKEHQETEERDAFLAKELVDLQTSSDSLQTLIRELSQKLDEEFKIGVEKINQEFNKFFTVMFGGGKAGLTVMREKKRKKAELDEDGNPLETEESGSEEEGEEGIDIDVVLPYKKVRGLMMLSGGERALTSIALLFAISQVNPPPFIILDETDAALDEANSKKYGDMIERLSSHSGLILITHNRETMSRAGIIYGVTMGSEGFSKLLSIQFEEAVSVAK